MFSFLKDARLHFRITDGNNHACYLSVIHKHGQKLAEAANNTQEAQNQGDLVKAFDALGVAYRSINTKKPDDAHVKLLILEAYEYNLGKCEYKKLIGMSHLAPEFPCSEDAFYGLPPLASELLSGASPETITVKRQINAANGFIVFKDANE